MVMKRVPSFSSRPGFPAGLQILVLDSEHTSQEAVASQLKAHSYQATCCCTCGEALEQLGTSKFDVILAEAKLLAREESNATKLREKASSLPLVLMTEDSTPVEVLQGIKLGACDFLEKPLSSLKLKNIWQHVVRKMMEDLACSEDCADVAGDICQEHSAAKKSVVSAPSCPKTPSPAASGADIVSIATSGSKANDMGESLCSEARKENCSDPDALTESSDVKSCTDKCSRLKKKAGGSSRDVPASSGGCSVSHRPPLAIKLPHAPHPGYHHPAPGFSAPCMFMAPGGWGQPSNPCVMGTPMMPGTVMPGGLMPQYAGQMPLQPPGYGPMGCMPGFMPTPMGAPGLAFPAVGCHYQAGMYGGEANMAAASYANYTGHVEVELSGASTDPLAAPIGLTLHKSASLADLISERLNQPAY